MCFISLRWLGPKLDFYLVFKSTFLSDHLLSLAMCYVHTCTHFFSTQSLPSLGDHFSFTGVPIQINVPGRNPTHILCFPISVPDRSCITLSLQMLSICTEYIWMDTVIYSSLHSTSHWFCQQLLLMPGKELTAASKLHFIATWCPFSFLHLSDFYLWSTLACLWASPDQVFQFCTKMRQPTFLFRTHHHSVG